MFHSTFQLDKSFQFSEKAIQTLLVTGCESLVKEIKLQVTKVWGKQVRTMHEKMENQTNAW